MENIHIHTLVTDGLQTRATLNEETVADYTEILREGGTLPPVVVFRDIFTDYLADGFHRLEAAKRLGRLDIEAEVRDGDRTAALRYALKANATHGLRRTNEDKRNALRIAWENRQTLFKGEPSVRDLAAITAVSHGLAHLFVKNMTKVSKMDTSPGGRAATAGDALRAPRSDDAPTDRNGTPIPDRLRGAFDAKRIKEMSRTLRTFAADIERARKQGDCAFSRISQSTLITLRNAAADLKLETPWCVCRQCQGVGCRACGQVGVQTRQEYDLNPMELKA